MFFFPKKVITSHLSQIFKYRSKKKNHGEGDLIYIIKKPALVRYNLHTIQFTNLNVKFSGY